VTEIYIRSCCSTAGSRPTRSGPWRQAWRSSLPAWRWAAP
jgi:hypothetical protein